MSPHAQGSRSLSLAPFYAPTPPSGQLRFPQRGAPPSSGATRQRSRFPVTKVMRGTSHWSQRSSYWSRASSWGALAAPRKQFPRRRCFVKQKGLEVNVEKRVFWVVVILKSQPRLSCPVPRWRRSLSKCLASARPPGRRSLIGQRTAPWRDAQGANQSA